MTLKTTTEYALSRMTLEEVKVFRDRDVTYERWSAKGKVDYESFLAEVRTLKAYYSKRCIDEDAVPALEKEFRATYKNAQVRIQEQMDIALEALRRAEKISDETGIPFHAGCSPLSQQYQPGGSKFEALDEEVLEEFDIYPSEWSEGWYGWEHSAVC